MGLRTRFTEHKVLNGSQLQGLLLALAYLALALIHWRHSWWKLSNGQIFADLGDSRDSDPLNEVLQALTLVGLFGFYLYGLVKWERREFSLREVSLISIAPIFLAWSALPANSTDLLAYIGLGRMTAIYGANPYIHTYSEFNDFFSSFVQWDITMPYGPVVLPFFILAGKISQLSVLGAVFLLKFIWLIIHYGNCLLLSAILKTRKAETAFALFLFGLNPLILLELIANGHNDGLLIFFGLLSILALQKQWSGAAVVLALLSALVKLPGIFLALAVMAYLLRRRDWRAIAQGVLVSSAILFILKVTLFPSFESLMSLANTAAYTKNSLHDLLIGLVDWLSHRLGAASDYERLYTIDRRVSSALFLCFCLWRLWRIRDLGSLVNELIIIFLALLIGYTAWFFPWYVAWLVPLAALTESLKLRWTIITFSGTSLALYAFPNFVVEQAPLHWLWASLRIGIVHLIPLILLALAYRFERQLVPAGNHMPGLLDDVSKARAVQGEERKNK